MRSSALRTLLASLPPPEAATFSIAQTGTSPASYVGIDAQGRPCLLVETSHATTRTIVRRGIRLQHRNACHVELSGVRKEVVASLVACEADDPGLREAFVSVVEIVLARLSSASEARSPRSLRSWSSCWRGLGSPAERPLLACSPSCSSCTTRATRRSPSVHGVGGSERYDIDLKAARIEVKASGNRQRRHSMSLEQCVPEPGIPTYLASTLVVEATGGTSVRELAGRLKARVMMDAALVQKVEQAVIEVMGFPRHGETRFDESFAREKLRWFDVATIPAIRSAPTEVDQVRFRVDLAGQPALSMDAIRQAAPALAPCLPT